MRDVIELGKQILLDYENALCVFLVLNIFLMVFAFQKRKSLMVGVFFTQYIIDFGLYFILYLNSTISEVLLISILFVEIFFIENDFKYIVDKVKNPKNYLIKRFVKDLILNVISIYSLFSIDLFLEHTVLKYGILLMFAVNIIFIVGIFKNQRAYLGYYDDSIDGFRVLRRFKGSKLPQLPLLLLFNKQWLSFVVFIEWISSLHKSGYNCGVYDTRNRISSITFNKDSAWQSIIVSWTVAILVVSGFSTLSFYWAVFSIGVYNFIRPTSAGLSKYYSAVMGEVMLLRPSIYDNILARVLPEKKKDFRSAMYLKDKGYSYSVYFHNVKYIFDEKLGFVESILLVRNASHLIIRIPKEDIPSVFYRENAFHFGLKSPITIIDVWHTSELNQILDEQLTGDYGWLRHRLYLVHKLSDEAVTDFSEELSSKVKLKNEKQHAEVEATQFRASLLKSSSFEALRQNIHVFEHHYTEVDHTRVKQLTGKGIYELNTLFRQLHESPSIPSRFIDLLNVAECAIRYLVGFAHAQRIPDGTGIHGNLAFDTKAIAFGSCNDFLARWKKAGAGNETLLGTRISAFLDVVYEDEKNIEELVRFIRIMNPGVSAKYSQKPTMLELCWWLVTIRNKTRGHGTPSKVDFNFYIALEKTVLFMLAELAELQLEPCYIAEVDSIKWSFSLWNGGYPDPVPLVDELQKNVHFNPMADNAEIELMTLAHNRIVAYIPPGDESLYLRVADDGMEEWWKCDNHFNVKDAIVHLLNQRDEKKESWISFSTGRIMRPEISEM